MIPIVYIIYIYMSCVQYFSYGTCSLNNTIFIVRPSALVRPCLGLFLFVTTFLSFRFVLTLSLLFSCLLLPLALPLKFPCARYPVCVRYTPRAWDPLLAMLNGPLYFGQ